MKDKLRPFVMLAAGVTAIAFGLYAIDEASCRGDTWIVTFYVLAGGFGIAALIEKIWAKE